jgi:uncharacterized alkaline shock family protein YloU
MSTSADAPPETPGRHSDPTLPAAGGPDDSDLDGRGRTTIADRVVEKIAAYAAAGVTHATGAPRRVLGVTVDEDPDVPQVSARLDSDVAIVTVHLAVVWPAPVHDVTRAVRSAVIGKLTELAGVTRAQVDIDVAALTTERTQQRRVS